MKGFAATVYFYLDGRSNVGGSVDACTIDAVISGRPLFHHVLLNRALLQQLGYK